MPAGGQYHRLAELCQEALREIQLFVWLSNVFLPLFQESRDSDTVNKIRIGNSEIYLIALIEHQSENDFDMSFRILRYIVFIWTDYAAQQECPR